MGQKPRKGTIAEVKARRSKKQQPPAGGEPAPADDQAPGTDAPPVPGSLRSRIVGEGFEAPDQLLANPLNWRVHPKHQADALEGVLEQVGWVQRVIVNRTTGHVVDGHLRVQLALRRNEPGVPVLYVELTPNEERLILATIDPIAGLASVDQALLDQVLQGITADSDALAALLQQLRSEDANAETEVGATDDDEIPFPREAATSQPGDVWILGKHRLIVGDSTSPAVLEELMAGAQADMLWVDPPYNVDYEGAAGKLEGDNQSDAAFRQMLDDMFGAAIAVTKPGGPAYVAHADSEGLNFRAAFAGAGWELKQCLVWVKDSFTLGRQDHQWQHEPILYGWKPGAAHCWYGERDKSTVFDDETPDLKSLDRTQLVALVNEVRNSRNTTVLRYAKPKKSDLHPTMKPVALVKSHIRNSSRAGELVLDFCGGSGTTLIACEALGRKARLVEKDPIFADVIIRRWEAWTKGQARRLSDGLTFLEAAREPAAA